MTEAVTEDCHTGPSSATSPRHTYFEYTALSKLKWTGPDCAKAVGATSRTRAKKTFLERMDLPEDFPSPLCIFGLRAPKK